MKSTATKRFFTVALALLLVSLGAVGSQWLRSTTAFAPNNIPTVAIVNGRVIPATEIDLAVRQSGGDRAGAVDSAINRAVFASAGEREFANEASVAVSIATREALASTYLIETSRKLDKALTSDTIKTWYDKNVLADDYKLIKARYILTTTNEVAQAAADSARAGNSANFQPLAKGDGFLVSRAMPYGIGPSLSKLKAGDVAGPAIVREGYLVVYIDAVKPGEVPTIEASTAAIRQILVQDALAEKLKDLRAEATITLK